MWKKNSTVKIQNKKTDQGLKLRYGDGCIIKWVSSE